MTARELQEDLAADLAKLFQDRRYKSPGGGEAALNIFKQSLPVPKSDEDAEPFPYVIVNLDRGGVEASTEPEKINVVLVIGIFDDDAANQGHATVLEILERIQERYLTEPKLGMKFYAVEPFVWILQDQEQDGQPTWPYSFGAAQVTFATAAPRHNLSKYT